MSIAILYNRLSAGGKAKKIAWKLHERIPEESKLFENTWPASLNEFNEIWLVGGDGTVNYFLNYYTELTIPLVIFPGGTGNDIHWKLYGPMTWEMQLEQQASLRLQQIDMGLCNGMRFLNGVGIGFDGEVLKSMDRIRKIGGHLGYLLVVLRQILTFREPEFQLEFNAQSIRQKCMLLSIANSSRTGGGFMVSPLAEVQDGLLNLIFCDPISVGRRLLVLPSVEKGTHLSHPAVHHQVTRQVEVRCERKLFAQLDGELISGDRFSIRLADLKLPVKCLLPEGKSPF